MRSEGWGQGLDLVWIWSGSGLDLVWIWSGSGLDQVWVWSGSGLDLVWVLVWVWSVSCEATANRFLIRYHAQLLSNGGAQLAEKELVLSVLVVTAHEAE